MPRYAELLHLKEQHYLDIPTTLEMQGETESALLAYLRQAPKLRSMPSPAPEDIVAYRDGTLAIERFEIVDAWLATLPGRLAG